MNESQFLKLLDGWRRQQLNPEEVSEFLMACGETKFEQLLGEDVIEKLRREELTMNFSIEQKEKVWDKIQEQRKEETRIHFLQAAWLKYAAAIIVMIGLGVVYYASREKKEEAPMVSVVTTPNDVAPGRNKAVLTLADGKKIILDSTASGVIAKQSGAVVQKDLEGRIVYEKDPATETTDKTVNYNTMSTPRGGQYELQLPDGSRVWLNAASSISYPTAFIGKERKVSITGEVYFEVAKNVKQPFRVIVGRPLGTEPTVADPNAPMIEVLGTHFNVNAYTEENSMNTTLLEGSVRIKTVHTTLTLHPGQQGQWTNEKLSLADHPDLDKVMAWRDGLFYLNNTDLRAIMLQISRWYDVDVVFESDPKNETFVGGISRNLPLSEILDLLKTSGVSSRLEGKKLFVRP